MQMKYGNSAIEEVKNKLAQKKMDDIPITSQYTVKIRGEESQKVCLNEIKILRKLNRDYEQRIVQITDEKECSFL